MKRATKLMLFGAAAAAVGGLLYRHYQDSYEQLPEEESDSLVDQAPETDFEYLLEDQIMFEE